MSVSFQFQIGCVLPPSPHFLALLLRALPLLPCAPTFRCPSIHEPQLCEWLSLVTGSSRSRRPLRRARAVHQVRWRDQPHQQPRAVACRTPGLRSARHPTSGACTAIHPHPTCGQHATPPAARSRNVALLLWRPTPPVTDLSYEDNSYERSVTGLTNSTHAWEGVHINSIGKDLEGNYTLLTGHAANDVCTRVTNVPKAGFETKIHGSGIEAVFRVAALAKNGTTLGTSAVYNATDGSVVHY
ncbi:hypothetical protein GGX14DRAFT_579151 [Mycena pura]|uniref:Uncharacterized protein n=1 Tax=Mycena pura TaxID=153505 RepID=A0AAD6Y2A4_9AGAR|nr:hypothetical protein GGX14DRAFT_579151 [Mycena pura]